MLHVATEAFQGALNAMCISQASTIHTYIQLYTHTHRHTSNEIVKVVVMVRVVQSNTTRFAQHCTVDRPDCHADDIDSIFASLLTHIFASWIIQCKFHIEWEREWATVHWTQTCTRTHQRVEKTINGVRYALSCHISVPFRAVDCVTLLIYWTFDRIRQ